MGYNVCMGNKVDIYECKHFEYEYDDFGKYCWCHCPESGYWECPAEQIYAMQFCPCFMRGKLRGTWEPDAYEIDYGEKFKKKMVKEANERELKEFAMLKYLKRKYES